MDSAQIAARNGRPGSNRVHDRQAQRHQDQRGVLLLNEEPLITTRARITGIGPGPIHIVRLALEPSPESDADFSFIAGQYTSVHHPSGSIITFSIASSPSRLPELELHFQPMPGAVAAEQMLELLENETHLQLATPSGNATLSNTDQPLLFICGGSGVAQAWSMIEWLASEPKQPQTTLLWCVDDKTQLYLQDRLIEKEALVDTTICIDSQRNENNSGLAWLRRNASGYQHCSIYVCGSPPFVYAVEDTLRALNDGPWQLTSDVFDYAPRSR